LFGYLWAAGDARTPLRANVAAAVVWIAVALPLLPLVGVAALAIGWLAAALTDASVLLIGAAALGVRRTLLLRPIAVPVAAASVAAAVGWLLARDHGSAPAIAGELCCVEVVYLALLVAFDRARADDLKSIARRLATLTVTAHRRAAL
jgi:peptidoglycan biosynthesis protein MviN/MurJ (putative lipid II flippase)